MGRKIKSNNIDRWELWSTVSDSIIAEFNSEEDLKKFIAKEIVYNGKLKAIEESMSFPFGWCINDLRITANFQGKEYYLEWYKQISEKAKTYDEYYAAIDKKLNELL